MRKISRAGFALIPAAFIATCFLGAKLGVSNLSHADVHLGRISDSDGFTNVRKKASMKSAVVGKFTDEKTFFVSDLANDKSWYLVSDGENLAGYMHASRVELADAVENFFLGATRNYIVVMNKRNFDPKANKVVVDKENSNENFTFVKTINGSVPYGRDGGMPKTEIDKFTVFYKSKPVKFPRKNFHDCFEPNTFAGKHGGITLREKAKNVVVRMEASDGAGFYTAVWTVNGKSGKVRRKISGSE